MFCDQDIFLLVNIESVWFYITKSDFPSISNRIHQPAGATPETWRRSRTKTSFAFVSATATADNDDDLDNDL